MSPGNALADVSLGAMPDHLGRNVCKTWGHSARQRDCQGKVSWFWGSLKQTFEENRPKKEEGGSRRGRDGEREREEGRWC